MLFLQLQTQIPMQLATIHQCTTEIHSAVFVLRQINWERKGYPQPSIKHYFL